MKSISSAIITSTGVALIGVGPLYHEIAANLPAIFMLCGIAIALIGFVNWISAMKSE